jgi:hypothetical protein
VSYCATLLFANRKLTLLIAALSWILLTRGIVDDQKGAVLVYRPKEEKTTTTAAKNKLQFVNNV